MLLKPRLGVVICALLLTAACGASAEGPPAIDVDRTACSHCGMLVSEPLYAAAYQVPGADARVFDDIGCLLDALRLGADAPRSGQAGIRFWFHDAGDGAWIDGASAVFVSSAEIRTPMGGGFIAFRDAAAAQQAAVTHHGDVVRTLPELLTRKGGHR